MHDTITTLSLVLLTAVSALASVLALRNLVAGATVRQRKTIVSLIGVCALGSLLLFTYRLVVVHREFTPLTAHVDGLLLIAALLSPTIGYLHARSRIANIAAFALPLLTVIFAWGICASAWTLRLFEIHTTWNVLHLASVYLGTVFVGVAGVAGVMFLYAQHRLKRKTDLAHPQKVASLESIEKLIINASVIGFALLTLSIALGVVLITGDERAHSGWWYSWKVALAAVVWVIFALVINVRHSTHFRGVRAAWLAIVGLVLLIVTMVVANMPSGGVDGVHGAGGSVEAARFEEVA